MDIKTVAIHRAIKLLDAAGVDYAVTLPDGTTAGTMKARPRKSKRKSPQWDFVSAYDYMNKIDALEPGDMAYFEFDKLPGAPADNLRGVINAYISRCRPRRFITATNRAAGQIEVLRVE